MKSVVKDAFVYASVLVLVLVLVSVSPSRCILPGGSECHLRNATSVCVSFGSKVVHVDVLAVNAKRCNLKHGHISESSVTNIYLQVLGLFRCRLDHSD